MEKNNDTLRDTINNVYVNSVYHSECPHLLPCGVCERTNNICPLHGWQKSQPSVKDGFYCNCTTDYTAHKPSQEELEDFFNDK